MKKLLYILPFLFTASAYAELANDSTMREQMKSIEHLRTTDPEKWLDGVVWIWIEQPSDDFPSGVDKGDYDYLRARFYDSNPLNINADPWMYKTGSYYTMIV